MLIVIINIFKRSDHWELFIFNSNPISRVEMAQNVTIDREKPPKKPIFMYFIGEKIFTYDIGKVFNEKNCIFSGVLGTKIFII